MLFTSQNAFKLPATRLAQRINFQWWRTQTWMQQANIK